MRGEIDWIIWIVARVFSVQQYVTWLKAHMNAEDNLPWNGANGQKEEEYDG